MDSKTSGDESSLDELISQVFPASSPLHVVSEIRSHWEQHKGDAAAWGPALIELLDFVAKVAASLQLNALSALQ